MPLQRLCCSCGTLRRSFFMTGNGWPCMSVYSPACGEYCLSSPNSWSECCAYALRIGDQISVPSVRTPLYPHSKSAALNVAQILNPSLRPLTVRCGNSEYLWLMQAQLPFPPLSWSTCYCERGQARPEYQAETASPDTRGVLGGLLGSSALLPTGNSLDTPASGVSVGQVRSTQTV